MFGIFSFLRCLCWQDEGWGDVHVVTAVHCANAGCAGNNIPVYMLPPAAHQVFSGTKPFFFVFLCVLGFAQPRGLSHMCA